MLNDALEALGPCLSTTLAHYLVEHRGLSAAAARQRISRAPSEVRRLRSLPFAHSAVFVYLKSQYDTEEYWEALYAAILSVAGAYSYALSAVLSRQIIPLPYFHIACGSPIAQKRNISSGTALERLTKAGVLEIVEVEGLGQCVTLRQTYTRSDFNTLIARVRSRIIAESILLDSVREWLRNLALASYDSVKTRSNDQSKSPAVGTFQWDLTAPSYSTGLADRGKHGIKPGFVVCDVLLTDTASLRDVRPFIHKVKSLQALRNIGRVMFFIVCNRYDSDAFAELRSMGVIPATTESLFGKEIAATFRDLIRTVSDAVLGVVNSANLDALLTRLGKLEGSLGNMRGAFFELLVAEVVRKDFPGEVKLNKICSGKDGKAEVDVWALKEGISARLIECKGMAPDKCVSDAEIELWLKTRIQRVRHHLTHVMSWPGPKPRFELWTSGILSPDAVVRIEKTRAANKEKYELVVYGPEEIRSAVKLVNDESLLKTLEHHFLPSTKPAGAAV